MEEVTLYELIRLIERGTKLHTGVVFLGDHGSELCALPDSHTIHSSTVCEIFKSTQSGLSKCMKCRNLALRRAIRDKKDNFGLCINGVFEYTRPVVISGEVVAVIFVGNILTDEGEKKLREKSTPSDIPFDSMERNFQREDCESAARLIESYIIMLIGKQPNAKSTKRAIIDNIKNYVLSNLEYDHRLSEIASLFFYNEVYLGRLFLRESKESFKDFLNRERVSRAKALLSSGLSVSEVAEKSGYNSPTYFNRIFKRLVGMTPSEYSKCVEF